MEHSGRPATHAGPAPPPECEHRHCRRRCNGDRDHDPLGDSASRRKWYGFGSQAQARCAQGFRRETRLLRDKAVPISAVFGGEALKIASSNAADATRELEAYLQERRPIHDTVSVKAREIVEAAEQNSDILSVARLSSLLGLTQRTMQEVCHRGLGVHPTWLIRRFRLQQAAAS